jgi:hypothetical protein
MNKIKEANAKISKLIAQAEALISEAEAIADETGASFSFSVAYGMGGSYQGRGDKVAPEGVDVDDWESSNEVGWFPSSQSC